MTKASLRMFKKILKGVSYKQFSYIHLVILSETNHVPAYIQYLFCFGVCLLLRSEKALRWILRFNVLVFYKHDDLILPLQQDFIFQICELPYNL